MDKFIGKDEAFVKERLSIKEKVLGSLFPRQGRHLLFRFVRNITGRMRRSLKLILRTFLVRLGFSFNIFSK